MRSWRQTCADCHYFVREVRAVQPQIITLEVPPADRAKAKRNDYSWLRDHYALCCNRKVWDEGHAFDPSQRHAVVSQINRRGKCFFWRFQPGMMQPAALELQKSETEAADKYCARHLTFYGLVIGALALIANAWVRIAEHRHWWPFE